MRELKEHNINIRVSESEKKALEKIACDEDISISYLVRKLIKEFLNKEN